MKIDLSFDVQAAAAQPAEVLQRHAGAPKRDGISAIERHGVTEVGHRRLSARPLRANARLRAAARRGGVLGRLQPSHIAHRFGERPPVVVADHVGCPMRRGPLRSCLQYS
jgi:hypothetical protein